MPTCEPDRHGAQWPGRHSCLAPVWAGPGRVNLLRTPVLITDPGDATALVVTGDTGLATQEVELTVDRD